VPEVTAEELNARYVRALNTHDWNALADVVHPDFVTEWPQSGERVRGLENLRQIFESYPDAEPGFVPALEGSAEVFHAGDRWIVTPMFTTIRVAGGPDRYTSIANARYPNGEVWVVISLVDVVDGRMHHSTTYFAPFYPAPAWRSPWVEPIAGARSS
jgi:ketosteroid isomerase-like protein